MENEIELSLTDTVQMMSELVNVISDTNKQKRGHQFPYKAVVSIAEGGVSLGKYIESKLWAPNHSQIRIQYRDEDCNIMPRPRTKGIKEVLKLGTPILLVDDIVDSGITIDYFQKSSGYKMNEDFDLATLHWCKELSPNLVPTFYHSIKSQKDWIVYPWERSLGFDEVWEFVLL
jgi:hypoxanthine phosphoribosyltransferase